MEPRSEFSIPCSPNLMSVWWARTVACLKKAVILWIYSCVCVCPGVTVWRCLSLPKAFVVSFIEQHRMHPHMGRNGFFTEVFHRISQGIKSLPPTDPDSEHHLYLPTSINVASNLHGGFSEAAFNLCNCSFQQRMHARYLGQGRGGVHNLNLQLCISSGCKRWLPVTHKASKANCHFVLVEAD